MNVSISRIRYVVVTGNKILCGLARAYEFRPIDDIGDTAIKTYLSEKKAKASFKSSYGVSDKDFESGEYKIVKVVETLTEVL